MPRPVVLVALAALAVWPQSDAPPARGAAPVEAAVGAILVDGFEDISAWSAHPAEGVSLGLASDTGAVGRALRLDVRFERGTGYAVARRAVSLDLPPDYVFRFKLRGEIPVNHLELKLVDSTGQNVWWHVRRDLEFPRAWRTLSSRRRQIRFAWGPAGGGEIRRVAFIEFAVTAGEGGSGSVWLDDLEIEPLPPDSVRPAVRARASSSAPGREAGHAVDGVSRTAWVAAPGDSLPWIELDLGRAREFGGLDLRWGVGHPLANYAVELSLDGRAWTAADTVREGDGGRDPLYLPESEARLVRIRALAPAEGGAVELREAALQPPEWTATPGAFFTALAHRAPRGTYPRPYVGEQCAWAVVGLDAGEEEALLSEDGMLETGQRMYSIEPFLRVKGRLVTWANVKTSTTLEPGEPPVPSVAWSDPDVGLTVTATAIGDTAHPWVIARYRVRNPRARIQKVTLYLAARPFQVNPPWQNLAFEGGVARITRIEREGGSAVRVNRRAGFVCLTPPDGFGATTFDQGEIVECLRRGALPPHQAVDDRKGFAAAAFAFALQIPPGGERMVEVLVPLRPTAEPQFAREAQAAERAAVGPRAWHMPQVGLALARAPDVAETVHAQIGWILVNRDGPAIQPGSRNYGRSWIRDGSLTSSALLRMGHPGPVRDFIEWFAPFQYENGKVPCCASARGPDPVTENDSHGQFIWLVAEYYRYTGDRGLVERMWPHVAAALSHLDSLRAERRTREWRTPEKRRFFGLLPPSISHEGYANPMHSYWDDFFAWRGYVDANFLAGVLGREADGARYAAARDTFARDLAASVAATMDEKHIDYVPGCAELGDFDATSTTVALTPTGAADLLPARALYDTFERYWKFFADRRDGRLRWDAFTPYEMRVIGAFVRLGWRDRAHQALRYFMAHRRPPGWRQWAEVEYREPRSPRTLGDLPHTWVGSDFVRSVLDMLAYERGADSSLVVAAGVPWSWIAPDTARSGRVRTDSGVRVEDLRTIYGPLRYVLRARGDTVEVRIGGALRVPPGGIVVQPPARVEFRAARVNGVPAPVRPDGSVIVRALPARLVMRP